MYAMEIVPPLEGRHGDSSGVESETLARGGSRVSRDILLESVQDFVSFAWKIRCCHDCLDQ